MDDSHTVTKAFLEEYCKTKKIRLTDCELDRASKDIDEILYSIGGFPSEEILKKMIPVYINTIVEQGTVLCPTEPNS